MPRKTAPALAVAKGAEPHIVKLLGKEGTALWNSPRGQALVAMLHPAMQRQLAAYIEAIVELTDINERIREGEANGEDMRLALFEGQGMVLHPLQKLKLDAERRLVKAEKVMGINPDALTGGTGDTADEAGDF